MDIVVTIAAKIGEYLVAPIGRQFGYVLFYNSHVGNFKDQIKELENKKIEVQGRTAEAGRNGDIILPSVTSWLERVEKITQESSNFFYGEDQVRERCFNVPYPDLKSHYKRGRQAKKKTKIANELQQSGNFERVSLSVRPSAARFKSIEAVEDFESREMTMKRVKEAIKDPKIKMVGIYGIGGVGKTTLVKEAVKQAEVSNQFEEVVMAVVSQTFNLERIQQQIAEMLGVKFDGESELGRAERLHARLKKKKILVILDDIWNPVNLEAIGIPFGVKDEGCKIVLTSRSKDVCNQMSTQRNVEVGILVKEEAWNLFRKMAGDVVDSPQIKPLASKVVKRCSGLPIAIVTIARALKDKSLSFWKDAANRPRISKEVSSTLQLSYDYLESEEAKSFFLHCCIYGEDRNIAIEDLWKYGMGLGSFQGLGRDSVEVARDRAYALAEVLKYSCLLQEGMNKDYVKMHDVVRDFAISVASKDEHGFLVRSGQGWNEFPDSNQFIRYTTISLLSDGIQKLPDQLECPKLELLYLECTHPSLHIPDNFFFGMKKLEVVVMSNMHFWSLPPSLVDLENLQALSLENCNFKNMDLSIIGKLKGLKCLSFFGSDMKKLPKEIGELIHLKLLDLSQCRRLKILPHDVIRRLSRLEGLYMGGSSQSYSFRAWEIEGQNTPRSNISLGDLKSLSVLTSLKIMVPNENCLPDGEDSLFKNLTRFQMCIGTDYDWVEEDYFLYSKALILKYLRNIPLKLLSTPFKTTEYLYLDKINGLRSILYDLEGESVLKCLTIKDCGELEYVFNTKDLVLPTTVSSLEKLDLSNLPNLKGISLLGSIVFQNLQVLELKWLPELINFCSKTKCNDSHMKNPLFDEKVVFPVLEKLVIVMVNVKDIWHHQLLDNFKILSHIRVVKCDSLKSLFQSSMASSLGQLQIVEIDSCERMETIIWKERDADEESCMERIIVFPQLRRLTLRNLPNLASFYQISRVLTKEANNLEDLTQPLPLFGEKVAFPVLEALRIEDIGNFKEIWHPQLTTETFPRLKVLEVRHCQELLNVIPLYMLPRFRCLDTLMVESCDSMEEVIGVREMQGSESLVGIQLTVLKLFGLPKLKSLFSPSVARGLVQLQQVAIKDCKYMETIVANEKQGEQEDCIGMINVFPQLHELELKHLPNLTSFYLGTCTLNWPSLKILSLENISDSTDLDLVQSLFNEKVIFPALEKLVIKDACKLKEIWHPKIPSKSFSQLKVLEVEECHELSSIIPFSLLQSLQSLKELCVESCDSLEEVVFEVEGHEVNGWIFPQLRKLTLEKLAKLKHIMCWDKYPLAFPSLITVSIRRCNSLKNLLPPSMANSLVQLQDLHIFSCKLMETIIAKETKGEEHCLNWSSLKTLWIVSCPAMKRFTDNIPCPQNPEFLSKEAGRPCPFFDNKVELTSLEKLHIHSMKNVEGIFDNQFSDESFCQLRELSVRKCDKLLRVVPSNLLPRLKKLQQLIVTNCNLVEEIFEQGLEEGQTTTISFTDLEKLELENLPNLKIFCSANYTLVCPSLDRVILKHCPRLHTFSSGTTRTLVLKRVELEDDKNTWKGDLNTTVQQLFHEKKMLVIKGGDGSSNKSDSSPMIEKNLQTPEVDEFIDDTHHDVFPEDITGGAGQNNVMGQDVQNIGDANMEGKTSTEGRERLSNNTLSFMPNQNDSTSMRGENPLTLEISGPDNKSIGLTEDRGIVSGDEQSCKWRIISSEEKGKAKVLDEGIQKVSHMTATSSHQPRSGSGISIRGSATEDPQTPKVDVADAGVFPDDIAKRALGDQKLRQNIAPVQGFVTLTENEAEADLSTRDTSLSRVAESHPTVYDCMNKSQIHSNEMVSRTEFESLQRDRDLLRRRVESIENLLSNTHLGEMVTGYRSELESIQRDRDLLRQRVETLEELLVVTGYRDGRPPLSAWAGLSTTLDVGWAAWSLLLVFGLLYFFAHKL